MQNMSMQVKGPVRWICKLHAAGKAISSLRAEHALLALGQKLRNLSGLAAVSNSLLLQIAHLVHHS